MRSVTVRLDDLRTMILNLGFVGENEHRKFNFDCKKMFGEYPSASVSLTVQPPAGDCYPATVERDGDLVSWTVTDSDLIEEGCGEIQLTFMVGEVKAKTCIGRTKVERSLGAIGDIPTPIENWIERAEEVISEAEAATAAAEAAAEHQPIIDDNGYWAVWDADAEEYVATEYKAQGTDGQDGVGIASIEKTGTSGLVDTYTITFTSGNPVTYTVTNGRDADPAELIDDTAGAGDTDKVWSADKSSSLLTEITQKVDKDGVGQITEENCKFFENVYKNHFDPNNVVVVNDHVVNSSARYAVGTNVTTLLIPVERSTQYLFYAPDINRGYVIGKSNNNAFITGNAYSPLLANSVTNGKIIFTTGETTDYVAIYISNTIYDFENKKSKIKLYKDLTDLPVGEPQIKLSVLPKEVQYGISCLKGANILIFGDSITDSCALTINSNHETTALSWTTNQYTNAQGNVISYFMWARMMNESGIFGEIRNYAKAGASYKDGVRSPGEERQNVSYQITVALNDLDNPNHVFSVDSFVPDIVIFALGTNDGLPNDTYAEAMAKTVYKEDNVTIDVDATLANLDLSKFCEAMRSAFLRTRVAFPYSQFYCVLPIQRANREEVNGEEMRKMARRYGCIIIDGYGESGIIRDTNVWEGLGTTLKDGLHPNDKGQNMMLRMILKQLSSHYCKADFMN